uniref:Uncharacterized protein n=1 Tax=Geladintestivirus 1 TaxID=3233133 RepID=A0AAU8MIG2_9CAUD
MNNIDKFYEESIEKWRLNRGCGTMLLNPNTDAKPIILGILQRIYIRNPACTTLILVKDFNTRSSLIEFLTHTEIEENNKEFEEHLKVKRIKIVTAEYAEKVNFRSCMLNIVFGEDAVTNFTIQKLKSFSYKLCILFSYISDKNLRMELYNTCPKLAGFNQNEIQALRAATPVEEIVELVSMTNDEVRNRYEECNKYISQSMNIFGNYQNMLNARMGDKANNISAATFCTNIAKYNGWSETLDMSIPFNVEIDNMYNPNAINERACITGEVISERSKLCTDCQDKLEKIKSIVDENPNSRILIINKRSEFANDVVDYINENAFIPFAGGYNDKMKPKPLYGDDGEYIKFKSGVNKGEIKLFGSQAQSTLNLKLFNDNGLKVLSVGNSPDKKLNCKIDIIIITSPLCDNIEEYIYRLTDVSFNTTPLKVYTICCKNTFEEKALTNRNQSDTHKIVNKNEISAGFDKNLGFVLVD